MELGLHVRLQIQLHHCLGNPVCHGRNSEHADASPLRLWYLCPRSEKIRHHEFVVGPRQIGIAESGLPCLVPLKRPLRALIGVGDDPAICGILRLPLERHTSQSRVFGALATPAR